MHSNDLLRQLPADSNLNVIRFDSSGRPLNDRTVLDLLTAEHNAQYLYRGQTDRYFRSWPAESRPDLGLNAGDYMLDSLIPSDYRGLEDQIRGGNKSDADVALAYGDDAVYARFALIYAGINVLQQRNGSPDISAWISNLPVHTKNFIMSLGQHMELPAENMDLSHSIEVAWWFATHSWAGQYKSGEGIIYRFNRSALETAVGKLNRQHGGMRAELIDIGAGQYKVPDSLTPRPAAQQGLTLAGGEVGEVLLELIAVDGVSAFVFQRDKAAYPLAVTAIKPSDDPLFTFIRQAKSGVWDDEWQTAVREILIGANKTSIPNIRDPRFRIAVFDGYDGLKKLRSKSAPER